MVLERGFESQLLSGPNIFMVFLFLLMFILNHLKVIYCDIRKVSLEKKKNVSKTDAESIQFTCIIAVLKLRLVRGHATKTIGSEMEKGNGISGKDNSMTGSSFNKRIRFLLYNWNCRQ